MAGAGGTSAVVPETGGTTSNGAGGAVGGQDSTRVVKLASKSGCSCALGATPSRASPGYLVAMLACLVLHRRRRLSRIFSSCLLLAICLLAMPAHGQRIMEKLGRGLVAVKTDSGYFLSWRLFGTEQGSDIAFNVYKGTTKTICRHRYI